MQGIRRSEISVSYYKIDIVTTWRDKDWRTISYAETHIDARSNYAYQELWSRIISSLYYKNTTKIKIYVILFRDHDLKIIRLESKETRVYGV